MSFDCDTVSNSPIYSRTRNLYAAGLIKSLDYSKHLYEPNIMNVTLHVVDSVDAGSNEKFTVEGLQNIFQQATVELSVTYTDGEDSTPVKIATNYFVHQVTPIQRSTSGAGDTDSYIEVKLLVYSMDKLFDIAKGCRSYVGLRLGHDIMEEAATLYKASATLAPKVNYSNMTFLAMTDGIKEALQPFLVQYNETFYTMLARTANRCGEFLYFEEGKLNLGVSVNTTSALTVTTGNQAGSVLLSSIEYPSKTINPFEAITYRYQRNPQNKVDLADDSTLSISLPNYNELPPKDSIQKMEEAIASVKVPLTIGLKKSGEPTDYAKFANSLENELNDLIDGWLKENNGKEPQQAYKDLAEIKQMIAKIKASKQRVTTLTEQQTNAETQLPAAEADVEIALEQRENAEDPELWHKKDLIYQQKLAKKQQYEQTIEQCKKDIAEEETKQQQLTDKLNNDYNVEDIDNFDEKQYIDKVKNYWVNVKTFIEEKLKKSNYYILKDKYKDEDGKFIDEDDDDDDQTKIEKRFVKTTIYTDTIKKIDALINLIPVKKSAKSPDTKETRIIQDLIQGADDYFGVGPALYDGYVDVMGCMSSKSTFSGMVYYLDKCKKDDKPAYNQIAYFLGLFSKFFNTTKPWVTFTLEQVEADIEAIAYAAETMAFTNESYNSHFYNDDDKEKTKSDIGLRDEFQKYALKEDADNPSKSKRFLYSVVSYPKHTFNNYKYKKPNSDGGLDEVAEYETLKSYFYKLICKLQELVSEERIVLNVRTADNQTVVKLGDTISHSGHNYIVIEDKASFDTERNSNQFTQRIVAIPVIESKPIPPMCPQGHFGKAGSQPGFVVDNFDPAGQGRVRVKFAWQKEEKDSKYTIPTPYIRVATPYATSMSGGIFFRPRVGDEVMISFEHDNPERPYVSSSLFNSEHKPFLSASAAPYSTVIASHNGHSINFYDENNAQFLTPILKSPFISQAFTSGVMGADSLKDTEDGDFAGNITLTDFLGMYKISASTTNRNITISSPMGDIKINAMTGITIEAPYGDIKISGKNISLEARNKITMTSGLAAKDARKPSVSFMDALKTGLKDTAAGAIKKNLPIDIGLVRCIMERFLEPIDGTTLIKSHNYLKLEAGTGVTTFENQENNSKVNYDQDISDNDLKKMAEPQVIGYLATEISKQMSGVLSEKTQNLESIREVAEQAINQYEIFVDKITSDNKLKKIIREGADAKADQYIDWAANHYVDTLKDAILDEKFYSFIYKESDAQFPKDEKTESVKTGFFSWNKRTYFVINIDCQAAAKRLRLLFASMCEKVCAYKDQLEKFKESLNADNVNTLMASKVQTVINAQVQPCSCLAPDKKVVSNVSGSVATLSGNIYDKYIGTEGCKAKIQLQPTADLATLRKKLPRIVARSILLASDALVYDESVAGSLLQKISPSTTVAIPSGQLAAAADAVSSILSNPTLAKDLSEDDVIDDAKWTAWVSGWSIEAVEKKKSFKDKVFGDWTDLADAFSNDLPYFGGGKGYKAINARQPGTILMSGSNGFMLSERDGRFKLVRINESIEALQEVLQKL